jgi:hypothetical protein
MAEQGRHQGEGRKGAGVSEVFKRMWSIKMNHETKKAPDADSKAGEGEAPERVVLTPFADGFLCDAPEPSLASCAEAGTPIEYVPRSVMDAALNSLTRRP